MSGFDDPGIYYSDSFGAGEQGPDEGGQKRIQIKKRFREFLRQFRVGTDRTGFTYKYRLVVLPRKNNRISSIPPLKSGMQKVSMLVPHEEYFSKETVMYVETMVPKVLAT